MAENENTEETIGRVRFPNEKNHEMFGIVKQLLGANQIRVLCKDGIERTCRIPGKMKKRVWIRVNDVVVVKLWDFQPSRADIVWRYMGNQIEWLKRKGVLQGLPV